jgi:hypothetical protein
MALCSGDLRQSGGSPSSARAACPAPAHLRGGSDPSPWDNRLGDSTGDQASTPIQASTPLLDLGGFQWGNSPVQGGSKPPPAAWDDSAPSPVSSQGSTSAPQRRGEGPRRVSPEASGGVGGQDKRQSGNGRRRGQGRGKNGSPQKGQAVNACQRGELHRERSDGRPPRSVPVLLREWVLWQTSGTDA